MTLQLVVRVLLAIAVIVLMSIALYALLDWSTHDDWP